MKINLLSISVCLILIFLCGGCTEESILRDPETLEKIESISKEEQDMIIEYRFDGMARKKMEFVEDKTVIRPHYYERNEIRRGDIIYYKIPREAIIDEYSSITGMARVIGLEGEKVVIKKGQLIINDKKLETFYGKLLAYGMDFREWTKLKFPGCDKDCQKTLKDYYATDIKAVSVPAGSVFVLADNSLRGLGSLNFGPLPKESIIGKVMGYLKE